MSALTSNEGFADRHIEEAEANYLRYEILRERDEFGWAGVLLSYSALHLIEAHRCKYHPETLILDHSQRNSYVASELREVNRRYNALYQASRSVRYYLDHGSEERLTFLHGDYNLLWVEMQRRGITWP